MTNRSLAGIILLTILGCGNPQMAQYPKIGLGGLWTNPNDLRAPEGALVTADNLVEDRPGIAEPRRGFDKLESSPSITGPINATTFFGGYLIAHHATASISRWTGAAWSTYSGTFTPYDSNTRPHFFTDQGSLFILTQAGTYELDAVANAWRLTGAPRGLEGRATLTRTSGTSGFAPVNGQWAYRALWAYKNANNKIQFGAPSGRFILTNPAAVVNASTGSVRATNVVTVTQAAHAFVVGDVLDRSSTDANFGSGQFTVATVADSSHFTYAETAGNATSAADVTYQFAARNASLSIPIPAQVIASTASTGYFLQIHRSGMSADATSEPNDALALVYEKAPTNLDIAAGSMTISDITPDANRSAALYTSLETVLAAKEQPPQCRDAAVYRESTFYVCTNQSQAFDITLLAVGGAAGLVSGDKISLINNTTFTVFNFTASALAEDASIKRFQVFTAGTPAQNIAETMRSLARVISAGSSGNYRAAYQSGDSDPPGSVRIEATHKTDSEFSLTVVTNGATYGSFLAPDVAQQAVLDSLSRTTNVVTVTLMNAWTVQVGQQIELVMTGADANFPVGIKTVASIADTTHFTYAETGANASSSIPGYVFSIPHALSRSDADARTNRLLFSPPEEPWAVPLVNERSVAIAGTTIHRVVQTRDKLFLWTSSGIYQVTGTYPDFIVSEFDTSQKVIAPETVNTLDNRAWGLTSNGFVALTEGALSVSVPIDNTLNSLQSRAPTELLKYAFAVPYDGEKRNLLWLPSAAGDTYAKQAFPFHLGSGNFTRWPVDATCGGVDPSTGKLYLGTSTGAVWVERKTRTAADYLDPGSAAIATAVEWVPITMGKPGALKLSDSGSLDFGEANFASGTLQFATDLSPTLDSGQTIGPAGGATTSAIELPFWIPMTQQRGTRYRVKFSASLSSQHFSLQGLSLNYRVTSQQTGR